MRRIKATIAYDGTAYQGWQVQPGLPTIQGALQEVVSGIDGAAVHVAGSGRTDSGVHALAQVAAFTIANPIPCPNLRKAMNTFLPRDIRVCEAEEVAAEFNPRHDAIDKTYEYRIYRDEVCPPHEYRYVHHYPYRIDWQRMRALAPVLEGEHDFSAFAAKDVHDSEGKTKVRTIFQSELILEPGRARYRVRGSGFLKHMVRNLVGTLLEVGRGNCDEQRLRGLLQGARRSDAGPTAAAKGLFLVEVRYR